MSRPIFIRDKKDDDFMKAPQAFYDLQRLKNVPLVEVPSTADEYMVSMLAERKNFPKVLHCNIDPKRISQKQSQFYNEEPLPYISDKLKPTKEWQNIQVGDFSDLRTYLSRMRKQEEHMKRLKNLNYRKEADLSWWKKVFSNNDPNLSIVLGFTTAQLDSGLENLISLLELSTPGEAIDHNIGRWIYALLACLKYPILTSTYSIIRELAKLCWKLRSHIDPEKEDAAELAAPLTLFICLVGRYFAQLDLADNLD